MKQRPIKFRAWDKHYECYIPTDLWAVVATDFRAFGIMLKDWNSYREGEYFYENAQTLEQFTGLHDRNVKEIYEHDKDKYGSVMMFNEQLGLFAMHSYSPILDKWSVDSYPCDPSKIEIVGNIHEK